MEPLGHDAIFLQATRGQFVILLAEDAAPSRHPWIGGLSDDDVVFLRAQFKDGARVLHPDFGQTVGKNAAVPTIKKFCGLDDWPAVFRDGQMLDRVAEDRAGGDAAAPAEDEHVLALRPRQHW